MLTTADLRNPYRLTVVPDAWQRGDAEVTSIHATAFQVCTRALDAVRFEGRNHGLLVLGEPGSGKTHLLSRLRRFCLGNGEKPVDPILPEVAFVAVKLAAGAQQIWRNLRKEFATATHSASPVCRASSGRRRPDPLVGLAASARSSAGRL